MATAPDPARVTRAHEKKNAPEDPVLVVSIEDVDYPVRFGDITGADSNAFRAETGSALMPAVQRLMRQEPDLDDFAALAWLSLRHQGLSEPFESICGRIRLTNVGLSDGTEQDAPDPKD